eukprot:scaffold10826_cov78-Cylindrotheca_fusiformis.AAC.1
MLPLPLGVNENGDGCFKPAKIRKWGGTRVHSPHHAPRQGGNPPRECNKFVQKTPCVQRRCFPHLLQFPFSSEHLRGKAKTPWVKSAKRENNPHEKRLEHVSRPKGATRGDLQNQVRSFEQLFEPGRSAQSWNKKNMGRHLTLDPRLPELLESNMGSCRRRGPNQDPRFNDWAPERCRARRRTGRHKVSPDNVVASKVPVIRSEENGFWSHPRFHPGFKRRSHQFPVLSSEFQHSDTPVRRIQTSSLRRGTQAPFQGGRGLKKCLCTEPLQLVGYLSSEGQRRP